MEQCKKSLTVVFVQNNIERKLIFRKDLKYVYEIRNTGDDIIYNLDYYIYIDKNNNMILPEGDLYYIFSCTEKKLYDRSTPIHVEYKVNNPNNIKPNEEGDVTKLYFKQKGDPIIYVDNPEGIGEHIFDNEELRSMYYYEYDLERGKNYTVEYYAIGGDDSVDGGSVFIALYPYNDNTTVTIKNKASGDANKYLKKSGKYGGKGSYEKYGEYMHKLKSLVAAETQLKFFNVNKNIKQNVKKGEVLCLMCNVLKEQMSNGYGFLKTDAKFNLINGKVKFSVSSKMKLQVCFLNPDDAEELGLSESCDYKKITSHSLNNKIIKFKYGEDYLKNYRETYKREQPTQTTAYMKYDTRSTIVYVDTNKPTKFCLSETADNNKFDRGKMYNDINSEYETLGINSKGIEKEGKKIHLGNYSIIYEVQLLGNNLKNKRLRIKPNFIDTASVLLYFNGSWHGYFFDKNNMYSDIQNSSVEKVVGKDFFDIPVPSDGFFKYLLPGANNGLTFFTVQ